MKNRPIHLFVLGLLLPMTNMVSCKSAPKPTQEEKTIATTPAAELTAASPKTTGKASLIGIVSFTGTPPNESKNPAASFPECTKGEAGNRHKAYWVKDGKLGNVFVYLKEGIAGNYPVPQEPAVLDQKLCAYLPRVFGIQVNQPLDILNSDPSLHNVHSLSKNSPQFNSAMPLQGMKITRKFSAPEVMATMKCDVHPWMRAYVGVLSHPFFSVTQENGSFQIQNVPPGDYVVEAWHEKLGTQTAKVTLSASEKKEISFTFTQK